MITDFTEHVDNVSALVYKCRRLIKLHESDGLELVGVKSMVIKEGLTYSLTHWLTYLLTHSLTHLGGKLMRVLLKHISLMNIMFTQHMEKILVIIADIQKITASLTKLFSDSKSNRNEADLRYLLTHLTCYLLTHLTCHSLKGLFLLLKRMWNKSYLKLRLCY